MHPKPARTPPAARPATPHFGGREMKPCQRCDHEFDVGKIRCPSCGGWNTHAPIVISPLETMVDASEVERVAAVIKAEEEALLNDQTMLLSEVKGTTVRRILTGGPWDAIFGRQKEKIMGHARQGVTLLGGKAGAGKSTLALQIAASIAGSMMKEFDALKRVGVGDAEFVEIINAANLNHEVNYFLDAVGVGVEPLGDRLKRLGLKTDYIRTAPRETLYVAAEEGGEDIRARYERLKLDNANLVRLYPMGCTTDLATVLMKRRPVAVFLDSLPQFSSSEDDAVALCAGLKSWAVSLDCMFIVIDHVNKSGDFSGRETLQHVVDTTSTLFPDDVGELRTMANQKNRYGEANVEVALLMTEYGLVGLSDEELAEYVEKHAGDEEEEDDDNEED